MSTLTIESRDALEKRIRKLTFNNQSLNLLKRLVTSCPTESSLLVSTYLPLLRINYNLNELSEFLPSASETISKYFINGKHIPNDKETVTNEDILTSFGSDGHITVISRIMQIAKLKVKPLLFTDPNITNTNFLYSHLIKIMRVRYEKGFLVGYHNSGAKVIGLHFPGSRSERKKLLEGNLWGAVHIATIVDLVDEELKNKIEIMQKRSQNVGHLLFEETKNIVINYTIKYDFAEDSTLSLTKKRFKI